MTSGECIRRMIDYYRGDHHDINHFMKVYGFAKTIGECEGLDERTQRILEIAAVVHDIACPFCREKYGSAAGKLQERESPALLAEFLADADLAEAEKARVVHLVSHHHTYEGVDGPDWQILLEADYLVNADEGNAPAEAIRGMLNEVFKTETGRALLRSIYREKLAEA